MSNNAFITRCKFTDLGADGTEGHVSYGIRVSDDHDDAYTNMLDRDDLMAMSSAEIVGLARGLNDRAAGIVDFSFESKGGIDIDGVWVTEAELSITVPTA